MGRKKKEKMVDPVRFIQLIEEYKAGYPNPMSNELGRFLIKAVEIVLKGSKFNRYTDDYKNEFYSLAIERLCSGIHKYDSTKDTRKDPMNLCTQTIIFACQKIINERSTKEEDPKQKKGETKSQHANRMGRGRIYRKNPEMKESEDINNHHETIKDFGPIDVENREKQIYIDSLESLYSQFLKDNYSPENVWLIKFQKDWLTMEPIMCKKKHGISHHKANIAFELITTRIKEWTVANGITCSAFSAEPDLTNKHLLDR